MIHPAQAMRFEQDSVSVLLSGTLPCPRPAASVGALILAGTHSWGDDVLERVSAKPLLPVALRPLIAHGIQWLHDGGIASACVCANSETSILQGRLGDGRLLDTALTYYEDRTPRGPAGCVRDAALTTDGDAMLVMEGSIVPRVDMGALLEAHFQSQAALTVVVEEAPRRYVGDRGPDASLEPVGIYVFSREALSQIPASGYQDIKEILIPKLYARGLRVLMHSVEARSAPRVSGSASYLDVNLWAVSRLRREDSPRCGFVIRDGACVHESATVAPTARLKGAVLIGPGSEVQAGAMIIGPTVVGSESCVQRDAVVSRSVIWDRCTIGAGALLDRSILTHDTALDAAVVARDTVLIAPHPRRWR